MDARILEEAASGDARARSSLASSFDGMIRAVAVEYFRAVRGSEPLDDLVQVGRIGFLEAVDRFDPSISPAFIPYARNGVRMAIREHLSRCMRLIRLPRGALEKIRKLSAAVDALGPECTRSEIMEKAGFSERMMRSAERIGGMNSVLSLDAAIDDDGDGCFLPMVAADADVEKEAEEGIAIRVLEEKIGELSPEDSIIINSYYGTFGWEKQKASDIAMRLSITPSALRKRVRRIERELHEAISQVV